MFTQLITTYEQSRNFRHVRENYGSAFVCAECNEAIHFPIRADGSHGCGTGYGVDRDNRMMCYPCCDKREVAVLVGAAKAYGYISSDGRQFTTWTGGKLGTVVWSAPTALPFGRRHSWIHGNGYCAFNVRDVHGQLWHGKGSRGVCITLRRMKG